MKLKRLLKDIPVEDVKGSKDVVISGLCANSQSVGPGNLFIAKKGKTDDGVRYIPEAIAAGACAILTDMYDPSLKNVVQIIHPHVQTIEGALAAEYYHYPSDDLFMVGITGTNGKTTTSFMIKYLLDAFQGPCGLIGTIEYIVGMHRYQATRTTPDVISNHKMLREMLNQGCRSAVMEVTSHALDQGRVEKIEYDIAVFTNLTVDHLDYHGSMENYCKSKNQLFRHLGKSKRKPQSVKTAIVNQDSQWTAQILEGCEAAVFRYGIDQPADLRACHIRLGNQGTDLDLLYKEKSYPCYIPFIGRFNVYNCLAAISVALVKGIRLEKIIDKLALLQPVRGRLEPVKNALGLKIYVDFAHSDDALENVLKTLNELKQGRIITVFGCGGDRDRTKRPKMAAVCERYSDLSILTSDNPRSEDPEVICQEAAKGFTHSDSYLIEIDRQAAIQKAIELATKQDIILIAGKGHETYQIFAHKTIEFDDCKVAADICAQMKN